jgi:transposase
MRDTDLYARILGVESPWQVTDVALRADVGEVEVKVEYSASATVLCPECRASAARWGEPGSGFARFPTQVSAWRFL